MRLGENTHICDAYSYLISSIDVPVESQIVEASEDLPLLSLLLKLDMALVREILLHENLPDPGNAPSSGLGLGETSLELFDVCGRLIDLLGKPHDIPIYQQTDLARDRLPDPLFASRPTSPFDRNQRRPQQPHSEGDHLAQGELQQTPAY